MLIYLASEERQNLLDFYFEDKADYKVFTGQTYSLLGFAKTALVNFENCDKLVIDLSVISERGDQFVNALRSVSRLYPELRIIALDEGMSEDTISMLVNEKIYNVISAKTIAELKTEISESLSKSGMKKYRSACGIDANRAINIAVVASESKLGATTVAFSFAAYLVSLGEENIEIKTNNGDAYIEIENTALDTTLKAQKKQGDAMITIYDGIPTPNADITIAICGTKRWELGSSAKLLFETPGERIVLLPFVPESQREKFRSGLFGNIPNVLFLEYQPSLTEISGNLAVYNEIAEFISKITNK